MRKGPRVLLYDIETAPIVGHVWSIWEQNVGLNQIKKDWHVMAWAAKWLGDPPSKIMYMDQRNAKNIEDDKEILKGIWKLLDECDVVITQNGRAFDEKKLNARFILNGMGPPSPYKHIDTKVIASGKFAFTSNKLEYMTDKLCVKYKKIKHEEFGGFELWKECLAGNIKAWREMEKYNKYDVLSLEELYTKLAPWDRTVDFNVYTDSDTVTCNCGSARLEKRGFNHTASGKFQRYQCRDCGAWVSDKGTKNNLLSKAKRANLKSKI